MLKAKFTLLEGDAGRLALVSGEVRLSEAQHSSSSFLSRLGDVLICNAYKVPFNPVLSFNPVN
jgi:hypothetical protein